MELMTNGAEKYYRKICPEYDIDFIDMSEPFMRAYESGHIVPYGFNNTTMGDGHINRAAHMMMAEELFEVLKPD